MRFGTEDEGTYYWFNFQNRKLYTDPQYKHILHLELEVRASLRQTQLPHHWTYKNTSTCISIRIYDHMQMINEQASAAQAQEQQRDDPKKKEEQEHQLRLKKATEKFFASGLRKFWLRSAYSP